jgi:hypothetical protein
MLCERSCLSIAVPRMGGWLKKGVGVQGLRWRQEEMSPNPFRQGCNVPTADGRRGSAHSSVTLFAVYSNRGQGAWVGSGPSPTGIP